LRLERRVHGSAPEGRLARDLHHLEQVADVGESEETPLIVLGGVWFVAAIAVIGILALTLVGVWLFA
jgi:hypothetical protein